MNYLQTVLLLSLLSLLTLSKQPISVSILIQAQQDQGQDYLEIKLTITQQDQSLAKALSNSNNLVEEIKKTARTYCNVDIKNKRCDEIVQVGSPDIESKYQIVRKQSTFQHFIVNREITIQVQRTDSVGTLVDQLQKLGVNKFEEFNWKNDEETSEQELVIENAKERIQDLCEAFDYKFERIVEVTQVDEEQEEGKDEEGGDEEEEEEPNVYRVVAECVPSSAVGKTVKK